MDTRIISHFAPAKSRRASAQSLASLIVRAGIIGNGIPFIIEVIPAKAGIQSVDDALPGDLSWIPAFAEMTQPDRKVFKASDPDFAVELRQ